MLRLAAGSIVLNQNDSSPMSGEVTRNNGDTLTVLWSDGQECDEAPQDVMLTGKSVWEDPSS